MELITLQKLFCLKKYRALAYEGFYVTGVIDGPIRPDCKRSSWERVSKKEFSHINGHFARQMSMSKAALLDDCHNPKERKKLQNEIKSLNSESKSLENVSNKHHVPDTLVEELEEMIETELFQKDGYSDENIYPFIIVSKFQADSMIAQRILSGKSDCVLSPDSDFMVTLGPDNFIIRKIDYTSKNGVSENKLEIAGSSPKMFQRCKGLLRDNNRIEWTPVKYPILDFPGPKLRALVAITLGCDVWKGIHGLGPGKIHGFFEKLPKNVSLEQMENVFISYMIRTETKKRSNLLRKVNKDESGVPSFDAHVINTLVSAFLDEPAVLWKNKFVSDWNHMFGKPSKLPRYLHYFAEFGIEDMDKFAPEDNASVSDDSYDMCNDDESRTKGDKTDTKNFNEPFDFKNPSGMKERAFHLDGIEEVKKSDGVEDGKTFDDVLSDFSLDTDSEGCESLGSFSFQHVDYDKNNEHEKDRKKRVTVAPEAKEGKDAPHSQPSPDESSSSHNLKSSVNESNVRTDSVLQSNKEKEKKVTFGPDVKEGKHGPHSQPSQDESSSSHNLKSSVNESNVQTGSVVQSNFAKGHSESNPVKECSAVEKNKNNASEFTDVVRSGVIRTKLVQGPPIGRCKGMMGITQPHYYLEAEGTYFCEDCGDSFCYTCGYVPALLTPARKNKSYHRNKNK